MTEPLILVVDDEEHIGICATRFLERAGYRTRLAVSAEEALEIFDDEVDAVLTDCAMPGMSGDKLAVLLQQRKPSLRALLMSGNAVDSIHSDIPLESGVNFIRKPFLAEQLVAFVIQGLPRNPPASIDRACAENASVRQFRFERLIRVRGSSAGCSQISKHTLQFEVYLETAVVSIAVSILVSMCFIQTPFWPGLGS